MGFSFTIFGMDKEKLLKELTLEEKASLLVGYTNMTTRPIERLGIPSLVMSDGPNGVRKEASDEDGIVGAIKTSKTTCFPCGSALAQSFDDELLYKVGKQIAKECKYFKINAILGPAINIKRNPLGGRCFEYLSEDPYLSGKLSANYIKGVRSENVLACVKHYACNNLEKWRYVGDSIVDLRALNEIYLKPFEIAVKEGDPGMIMTSYNQINGFFASENEYLIKDRLINRFGFKGLTVTDWGGMVHRDISLNRGQDLEMPGMVPENIQKIVDGVKSGLISGETLDNSVLNLLTAIEKTRNEDVVDESVFDESEEVALNAAINSAVLLKNENHVLPLDKNKKLAIIGDLFGFLRFQGGGSALINSRKIVDNKTAFDEMGIDYVYAKGYDSNKSAVNPKLEYEAIKACKNIKTVVFFGGLTDLSESEGFDRPNMRLEKNQIHLIKELVKQNKTIICVLYSGSVFKIPEVEKIDGILYMNLPGMMGGRALTKLLFGEVSPSGRLAVTWPIKYRHIPYATEFNKTPNELYKESIFVGYRYFVTTKEPVLFPFGYGLSYGETSLSNFEIKVKGENINISFDIKNNSDISLKEVIQIYVGMPHGHIIRPEKELKKYTKVALEPQEEKHVELALPINDLGVYSTLLDRFVVEGGEYVISVSKNVNDDLYKEMIEIKGETVEINQKENDYLGAVKIRTASKEEFEQYIGRKIPEYTPKRPYTLETPICEYTTFFANIVKKEMLKQGSAIVKEAKKTDDPVEKQRLIKTGHFIKKMIVQNCLRSLWYSSGGILNKEKVDGILEVANGHPIRGFKKFKSK